MFFAMLMLAALLIELAIGWPAWLFAVIKHPVVWMGSLIGQLEKRLNAAEASDTHRSLMGLVTSVCVILASIGIAVIISTVLPNNIAGFLAEAVVASSLLASRSLYQHVNAVATPLIAGNQADARCALSHIVGRDTTELQESAMAGAAIESLAENASDGVYAPLFWGLLFGLPGIAGYKAINTLDSMIGHRTPRYLAFGVFAAKLDDLVNLIPARLSALLMSSMGGSYRSLFVIAGDARKHRSPNAGWPEGAMAYALGIRLSGPRIYNNVVSDEPWLNESGADACALDIKRALHLFVKTLGVTIVLLVLFVVLRLLGPLSA